MNERFENLYNKAEASGNLSTLGAFLSNIDEPEASLKFAISSALKNHLQRDACKYDMIKLLLKHGADPNFNSDDRLPLQIAVQNPHITLKIIQLLLEYGAIVVGNFDKNGHSTVLQFALQNSNITLDIVKLLLEHNNGKAKNGECCNTNFVSLLPFALGNPKCNSKFVKLLLKYGADANARGINNNTPLHLALQDQCVIVVDTLLVHGADVNLYNVTNITPLQDALKRCCNVRRFVNSHLCGLYDISLLYCKRKEFSSKRNRDMCEAFKLEFCTMSMIKHIIIRKTYCDFDEISNSLSDAICEEFMDDECCRIMDNHYYYPSLRELLDFLIRCVQEVAKMKNHFLSCCFTLQEFILFRDKLDPEKVDIHMYNILKSISGNNYPIYKDVIMSVFKRKHILSKIQMYARSGFTKERGYTKTIYLDFTSLCGVAKYLSKNDLSRLALAFHFCENTERCKNKQEKCSICVAASSGPMTYTN